MAENTAARQRALITGASAGIGAAFATLLAHERYDLVIVARRRERLEALAQRLQHDYGTAVTVLAADLTQPADLRTVAQHVAEDAALELLVNDAGFPGYMPFIALEPERAEELIRLHIVATTRLTRAALAGMVARDRGSIINVASMLAFSASVPAAAPLPKRAVYAACKAYIVSFTELIQHELEGTQVRVQALCPGLVRDTEFYERVPGFDRSLLVQAGVGPEEVVTAALRGLALGEVVCAPGLDDPGLLDAVWAGERRLIERGMRGALAQRYTV
jgi:short-subunit dehydrogenase